MNWQDKIWWFFNCSNKINLIKRVSCTEQLLDQMYEDLCLAEDNYEKLKEKLSAIEKVLASGERD